MLRTDEGYIVSRHVREVNGSLEMSYWVKTASKTVHLIPNRQSAVFFTDVLAGELLNSLNVYFEDHHYLNFNHTKVLTVYCSGLKYKQDLIQRLKHSGFSVYEEDIKPQDRYLMERGIRGAIRFIGECDASETYYKQAILKPAATELSIQNPQWKVWSVDIETSVSHNTLLSIGVVSSELTAVFCGEFIPYRG